MKKIAIYGRKSKFTGKGESIENQIIKCRKFIEFKFDIENDENIEVFIDEGFSGKNEKRPAYQEMIQKVKNKEIDKIVIYQLNRLGRNARDIHNTMEMCNDLEAIIYSATEGFDSSTSFGRAVIGILASLAQLEREQLAERVKDNMYTLAKMGRWLGGQNPLGYDGIREVFIDDNMKERTLSKLKKNTEELNVVKALYNKYLELKSLSQVSKWALQNHLKGKNGADLQKTTINSILQNPAYVKSDSNVIEYLTNQGFEVCGTPNGNGILRYGKKDKIAAIAKHKGIIDSKDWLQVQEILKENTEKAPRLGRTNTALLTSVLRCSCGSTMRVAYGKINKQGETRFYYTCALKNDSGRTRCNSKNLNGPQVERLVLDQIKNYNKDILIKELEEILKETNKIDLKQDVENLELEKSNNSVQIERLLNKLSLTDDEELTTLILNQIKTLKDKNKELDDDLNKIKDKEGSLAVSQSEIFSIIDKIDSFNANIDKLDFKQKKSAITDLIESIKYSEDNSELYITYRSKKK